MKRFLAIVCCLILPAVAGRAGVDEEKKLPEGYQPGARVHDVYLENTDHELHVYKIFGRKPGNTILIIGGIHGNEPGGYLAASHYTDVTLKQGNLFIVPRANLSSILQNERGHSGDYNRKFASELDTDKYDDKIISLLKELMEESDCVLNLHDGSGFYRETWIDEYNNPFRFGQSVIADCARYTIPGSRHTLDLENIARAVVEEVNVDIPDERYKFRFANHDSVNENTKYPDMRKTATYYALTEHHIPAFGVETSKSLPSDALKVEHQLLVINSFLRQFEIVPDIPAKRIEKARFDYLVIAVNDGRRYVVENGSDLALPRGSLLKVDHIVGNYEDTMFADILGHGGRNDKGMEVAIHRPLTIRVRKDAELCGEVSIMPQSETESEGRSVVLASHFILRINGKPVQVHSGQTQDVLSGDKVTIIDYVDRAGRVADVVNLKGFVGQKGQNTGEDRGFTADVSSDLMPAWSLNKKGRQYAIVARSRGETIDQMILRISAPEVSHAVVQFENEEPVLVKSGERVELDKAAVFSLLSVVSPGNLLLREFECTVNGKRVEAYSNIPLDLRINRIELRRGGKKVFDFDAEVTGR